MSAELASLIDALEYAVSAYAWKGSEVDAARTALIAGIQRYREEGQEAAAKVADAEAVKFDRLVVQCNMLEAAWYDWQNRAGVARTIAAAIRALHPTPLEEPKT